MKFIKPSIYMGGFDYVLQIWREADAKDKGILLLVFSPMFLCMAGFVFSIIYFVLFVLPSFLFRFVGWGLLTALFGAGGKYFYKHLTGREIKTHDDVIDVDFTENAKTEPEAPEHESPAPEEPKPETPKRRRKNAY